ncbi:hypothetical protein GMDG_00897 [Pseudogymnoascus destructans 20631-21]|uniref:Uncharacterized protein n=1 Tax=Pseudogymnoascus destructans (strain ATCC MYA-4855 / 20631-21) TaxID=658429 RepID=L8FLI6_PSED2|nr:hypothetical protein GMDG_00897 [Pseudogymnoascus destructans 20631-21]
MEGPIADRAEKSSRANSALGGAAAEPITSTNDQNRPFEVGGDTLTDFKSAASRTCDNQKNACAKIANEGAIDKATVTSFGSSASSQAQVVTSDDEVTYFCDP